MLVQITGIAQALSFETGESYSYLTLLLPTGKEVRATVADDIIADLTSVFMGSGSPAAQQATSRVQASLNGEAPPLRNAPSISGAYEQMSRPAAAGQPQDRSFAPVDFHDEDAVAFGGNFQGEDEAQLLAIEQSLAAAEGKLAHAVGDTMAASSAELRQVVARIQQQPALPVPNGMAGQRKQSARRVEADNFGNPVIIGDGLVDPVNLMGGDTEGEEDAGQV